MYVSEFSTRQLCGCCKPQVTRIHVASRGRFSRVSLSYFNPIALKRRRKDVVVVVVPYAACFIRLNTAARTTRSRV